MSEPKLISPMLDDFDMGGPISDHDGVRCCPAMRKNSDDKYIVKIISVPASQTKMDALLLTGAYSDKISALTYFKGVANGIVDDKKILDDLSQLEGFVSYDNCQVVPMEDESGYDVYLLAQYRKTLERQSARTPMTQLSAVNLGIDLCAALSGCRRSGYMYVDLKPSNIFVVGDNEYKIGDLGFVKLNALKYASLPDMYRSCYTAPELEDPFAPLNDTIDIYALGMILYQIFNGGELPFSGNQAPNVQFDAPACADEEMAAIILKACDPNPAERWQDPVQMGQAIVNYMQKNGVNDTPLVVEKVEPQEEEQDVVEDEQTIEEIVEETAELAVDASEESDPIAEDDEIVCEELTDETESEALPATDVENEEISVVEEISAAVCADFDEPDVESSVDVNIAEESESSEDTTVTEDEAYDNLSFLDDLDKATAETLAGTVEDYDGMDDDLAKILGQIDSLTAHEVPDPVVVPEPSEITIPEIPVEDKSDADESEDQEEISESELDIEAEIMLDEEEMPYVPKEKRTGLVICVVLAILAALAAGAYFFYNFYYLQPVHSFLVSGSEDTLVVELSTGVDESLLTVVCADSHGNMVTAPVVGGKAVFSGLAADTAYTVNVEVGGFHQLTGTTSKVYSTPVKTQIGQVHVITGSEDGSVILSFTVEGPDSAQWNVIYNAEGEAERTTAFPSHMVTLAGLTVGKEYTFRLEPANDIYLAEVPEVTYVAKNIVCAENLHVTACVDGALTAQWASPEGTAVSEWTVRCYNETGYDETLVTSGNTVTFENVDDTVVNSVEVTAADMSVSQRILVSANSVTVSNFAVDTSRADVLQLTWNANREIPVEGWTIRYTVNDINAVNPVISNENAAQIPVVPNGEYVFTILDGSGNTVLGGPFTHKQAGANAFDAYKVKQSDITMRLCKTPASSGWTYADLEDEDYVNAFTVGQKISAVLALSGKPEKTDDSILTTIVVYDENNNLISYTHSTIAWQTLWYQNYCEMDLTTIPAEAGTYNVIIYFNGSEVGSQKFEITA